MESGSEDDSDYVPPKEDTGGVSDPSDCAETPPNGHLISRSHAQTEHGQHKIRTGDVYAAFKASLTDPAPQPPEAIAPVETVKVVKRYRFAGEEITEVKEVPADSEEAKKWPLWSSTSDPPPAPSPSTEQTPIPEADESARSSSSTAGVSTPTKPRPPAKRPGPRKPKTKIEDIPKKQPIKRLTTLDKSAMDWRAHVEGAGEGMKDELQANRRGGGYLDKVDFLQRVGARKDEVLDANKGKRRR